MNKSILIIIYYWLHKHCQKVPYPITDILLTKSSKCIIAPTNTAEFRFTGLFQKLGGVALPLLPTGYTLVIYASNTEEGYNFNRETHLHILQIFHLAVAFCF